MTDNASDVDPTEKAPTLGTYTGERAPTGERHGAGKNEFPNGDIYEGQYAMGKRHGTGNYTWIKPKAKYSGEYVDNLRNGEGIICYPDGGRYKGNFAVGKRHGHGTYVYPNGDAYTGEFANDLKHGDGTYTFSATGSKKKGAWQNDILLGDVEIIHSDHKVACAFEPVYESLPDGATSPDKIVGSKPKMPATIHFFSSNYSVQVSKEIILGLGIPQAVKVDE